MTFRDRLSAMAALLLAAPAGVLAQASAERPCEVRPHDVVPSAGGEVNAFEQFDRDGNGRIDPGCESEALQAYGNVMLQGSRVGAVRSAPAAATGQSAPAVSAEARFSAKFRSALHQITAYEPVYALVGNDSDVGFNGKFQLSLNYRPFRDGLLGKAVPLDNLYFSFSQTSFWDFSEASGPFRDSSYRPRLYYRLSKVWEALDDELLADMDIGLGHESNGRDGPLSRSIDVLFVRPTLTYGGDPAATGNRNQWYMRPMAYAYLDDSENPDIRDFRGHIDLELGYVRYVRRGEDLDPWRAWVTLRKGDRSDYGSIEATVAAALATLSSGRLNGWLMVQYFNGYGESLRDYNRKRDSQLRAGVAILF